MSDYMDLIVWAIAFILAAIAESVTAQFIFIWFSIGALAALITAILGGPLWLQLLIFGGSSIILLLLIRPVVHKLYPKEIKNTNAQEIGKYARVIQRIDPAYGGRVRLSGVDWNAISKDGVEIPLDATVQVYATQGNKLIVEEVTPPQQNETLEERKL